MSNKTNIVLIGMPGAGKSTIGVLLAKRLALDFIDTDLLIQLKYGDALQSIVNSEGYMKLRKIEEDVICELKCNKSVIATGGSAAYSEKAMRYLQQNSTIIFLHVQFEEIKKRVTDFDSRGIAMRKDQTFKDLFNERYPLYCKYADITIDCQDKNQDSVTREICNQIK